MFRIDRAAINFTNKPALLVTPGHTGGAAKPVEAEEARNDGVPDYGEIRRDMVERVQEEARSLLEEAKKTAEGIREKAREEGRVSGIDLARAEAAAQLAAQRAQDAKELEAQRARDAQELAEQRAGDALALEEALSQIRQGREAMFDQLERHTLALSLAIAEKILGAALDDRQTFISMVENAVRMAKDADRVTVRLSAEDYAIFFPDGHARVDAGRGVSVTLSGDTGLPRGSIIVEAPGETIDASVLTQLDGIREALVRQGAQL